MTNVSWGTEGFYLRFFQETVSKLVRATHTYVSAFITSASHNKTVHIMENFTGRIKGQNNICVIPAYKTI